MPDTYRITIGSDEYEVEANSADEAQAKAQAAASNAAPSAGSTLSGAEGISGIPDFQKNIKFPLPLNNTGELPFSAEGALETLPGIGGTLGALLTRSPAGASYGSMSGEAVRMALRKLMGFAPATGLSNDITGLDPNSKEAMALNLAAEGFGGGIAQVISEGGPAVRQGAARTYARILGPKSETIEKEIIRKLEPFLEELPYGGRSHINKVATNVAEKQTGPAVGALYNVNTPASFKPVRQALDKLATGQVRRPATAVPHFDPAGNITWEEVAADIKNPKLHRAYAGRADAMAKAERQGRISGQPTTLQDLFEARKAADDMATEKTFALGKKGKDVVPGARALKAERTAITNEMHDIEPRGELADAIHSAFKTVEAGTKGTDPGVFPIRWMLARFIPGQLGTTAGFLATKPAFWGSLGAGTKLAVSKALIAGDEVAAMQIMRTALDNFGKTQPPEEQP